MGFIIPASKYACKIARLHWYLSSFLRISNYFLFLSFFFLVCFFSQNRIRLWNTVKARSVHICMYMYMPCRACMHIYIYKEQWNLPVMLEFSVLRKHGLISLDPTREYLYITITSTIHSDKAKKERERECVCVRERKVLFEKRSVCSKDATQRR